MYPKRSQYKYAKSRYRGRNWAEDEASLQRRGDLTVWLSDTALDAWREPPSGKPGGQRTYADSAIEAALTIRMVFSLPASADRGFPAFAGRPAQARTPGPRSHDAIPAPTEARRDPVSEAQRRSTAYQFPRAAFKLARRSTMGASRRRTQPRSDDKVLRATTQGSSAPTRR